MTDIYLGIGSNTGNREQNITSAISLMAAEHITIDKLSTIIETEPVGGPPQGKFLNAVIKAATDLQPESLLKTLKAIEKKMGREKAVVNGPRIIDLDILLYDKKNIRTPGLTIPHPRMLERDFVMIPLKEIAPELAKELLHAHHHIH